MPSQVPLYNLKAVLKETGLKADVLRAWERRYDLPKPQRTAGGHRLYSEYDIETLRWLHARQMEGVSISQAVQLWKEITTSGRDPLSAPAVLNIETQISQPGNEPQIELLRGRWLEACLKFDLSMADGLITQAFALYPVEIVCTEILQEGLRIIGDGWCDGKVSVQQEHFASAQAVGRVETLITSAPIPTHAQTVLVGCPHGEWHTFPTLLLNLFLRRKGWRVINLGANIPAEQLEESVRTIHPGLSILAAQQLSTAASLQKAAEAFQKAGCALGYGGQIFNRIPELRSKIRAIFLGENVAGSVTLIEHLLMNPPIESLAPAVKDVPGEGQQKLAHLYREKRPVIEKEIRERLPADFISPELLEEINDYFGNALAAALDLGSPTWMNADLDWLQKQQAGRRIDGDHMNVYMQSYNACIRAQMNEVGTPITSWLDGVLARKDPGLNRIT